MSGGEFCYPEEVVYARAAYNRKREARLASLEGAIREFLSRQSRYHVDIHGGPYALLQEALKEDETDGESVGVLGEESKSA